MAISPELFQALLALDAYNRSYNKGHVDDNLDKNHNQLGRAYIVGRDDAPTAQAAGFAAYRWDVSGEAAFGGTTTQVIAFRGTDDDISKRELTDLFGGWSIGAGFSAGTQADLAAAFYMQAPGVTTLFGGAPSNILVTGHSLGGGLAAYVSALSGVRGVGVDYMPGGLAAWLQFAAEYAKRVAAADEPSLAALTSRYPSLANFSGITAPGEVLSYIRDGAVQLAAADALAYLALSPILLPIAAPLAIIIAGSGAATITTEDQIPSGSQHFLNLHGAKLNPFQLHSRALPVLIPFAEEYAQKQGWIDPKLSAGLIEAWFDVRIAQAVGLKQSAADGVAPVEVQLGDIIAYTVLDAGFKPFGDSAVRAMLDDADDLHNALAVSDPSSTLSASIKPLLEIAVQNAGRLALAHDEAAASKTGVFSLSGNLLHVDLTDATWRQAGEPSPVITGRDDVIDRVLAQSDTTSNAVRYGLFYSFHQADTKFIQSFAFGVHETDSDTTAAAPTPSMQNTVTLTLLSGGVDTFHGSSAPELVYGGKGDDRLDGGAGDDVLVGGPGDDSLTGGAGGDALIGGEGEDEVTYSYLDGSLRDATAYGVAGTGFSGLGLSFGGGDDDVIVDVEDVFLPNMVGMLSLTTLPSKPLDSALTIHAGSPPSGDGPQLSLTALGAGVSFVNGGIEDSGLSFAGFERITLTSFADVYDDASYNKIVFMGAGDDYVRHAGLGSVIYTGAGNDVVAFSAHTAIADLSASDKITFGGMALRGGISWGGNRDWIPGLFGMVEYGLNVSGDLIIRLPWWEVTYRDGNGQEHTETQQMFVLGWQKNATVTSRGALEGPGGIGLAKISVNALSISEANLTDWSGKLHSWDIISTALHQALALGGYAGIDPLVLDLDGVGLELAPSTYVGTQFDLTSTLYAKRTSWVTPGQAIVARDLNHDGAITDGREILGSASDGFTALAALDGNHDGFVNAADDGLADFNGDGQVTAADQFSELLAWRDGNGNGVTDPGELTSLAAIGVTGLSAAAGPLTDGPVIGGLRLGIGSYTKAGGGSGALGSFIFQNDSDDTIYRGASITLTAAAALQPDLGGRGTLVSLHAALSTGGADLAAFDAAVANLTTPDLALLGAAIRPALTAWAMGSPIRLSDGSIVTGSAGLSDFSDVPFLQLDGFIIDYAWAVASGERMVAGATHATKTWAFVSGATVELAAGTEGTLPSLEGLQTAFGAPTRTETVTSGTGGDLHHVTLTYGNGAVLTADYGSATSSSFVSAMTSPSPVVVAQATFSTGKLLGSDLAFVERFVGERSPFFSQPTDPTAALALANQYVAALKDTIDGLAVRLAVQKGPLSSVFQDVAFDAGTSHFSANTDAQLVSTYERILQQAATKAAPLDYLATWKPFFDVFLSDYVQNGSGSANTYGFLAQELAGAIESASPTNFSLIDAASAFGIPSSLWKMGSPVLSGSSSLDLLYIDSVAGQTASGGAGEDNYIIGSRFGHSTIDEVEQALSLQGANILRFSTLDANHAVASRAGVDLVITNTTTGDTLTILGQFTGVFPAPGLENVWDQRGVSEIVFADGASWTPLDMARAVSRVLADGGEQIGTEATDVFYSGPGSDVFKGAGGSDLYIISGSFGADTINDREENDFRHSQDVVSFTGGLVGSNVVFSRSEASDDLLIKFNDRSDVLTVKDQFATTDTGVYGIWYMNQIEMFVFADGISYSADDIRAKLIRQSETSGHDRVFGFDRAETLDGGAGNDYLSGLSGGDTYVWGRGYGNDTIEDHQRDILVDDPDHIRFTSGVSLADLDFTRSDGGHGSDLIITSRSSGETLTIRGEYGFINTGPFGIRNLDLIELFDFTDGTTLAWSEVMDRVIAGQATSGADHIYGTYFADLLDGGSGDDFLSGGNGGDTYWFGRGSGHDVISEGADNILSEGSDTVEFGAGVTPGNVTVSRNGNDLIITLDTGDTLTVKDQFFYTSLNVNFSRVESFTFTTGTTWSDADLRTIILSHGTNGPDIIDGFETDDLIDGGFGDDVLRGGDGSDTYRFLAAFGHDLIEESVDNIFYGDDDKVVFGPGLGREGVALVRIGMDLKISFSTGESLFVAGQFSHVAYFDGWNDIETFVFDDGVTWTDADVRAMLLAAAKTGGPDTIVGFFNDDVIDGGAGDDVLAGQGGSDTYIFGLGYGKDRIVDLTNDYYEDKPSFVQLKDDVVPADVRFSVSGLDLVISVSPTDVLTVAEQFGRPEGRVQEVRFSTGPAITLPQITARAIADQQTSGNDTITGLPGDDSIAGGLGNDLLRGAGGDDTYVYALGDGSDRIEENAGEGSADLLSLGAGISPTSVTVSRSNLGDDITLTFSDGGSVVLVGESGVNGAGVEMVRFSDGTNWSRADLISHSNPPPAATEVHGTSGPDTLSGGLGDQKLYGAGGNDSYIYNPGDGDDTIYDYAYEGFDSLVLGAGITLTHVVVARYASSDTLLITFDDRSGSVRLEGEMSGDYIGVEEIRFNDGTTWNWDNLAVRYFAAQQTSGSDLIRGFNAHADTIQGGGGDDVLYGAGGNDTYIYNSGDGADSIYELYYEGFDTLRLGSGLTADHLVVARDGLTDTLTLSFDDRAGSIRLQGQMAGSYIGVEEIRFADNSTWNWDDLAARYFGTQQTSGADVIRGFNAHADVLRGGGGNDVLYGGGGNDTYVYNPGDGADTIYELYYEGFDTLTLGDGITAAHALVARDGATDTLILSFDDGSGSIRLEGEMSGDYIGVERVEFADGTTWNWDDLAARYFRDQQTSGPDVIRGFNAHADTLKGGLGMDTLTGGGGADIFDFNTVLGTSTITDFDAGSGDRIRVAGLSITSYAQVLQHASNSPNGIVIDFGASASIVLANHSITELDSSWFLFG